MNRESVTVVNGDCEVDLSKSEKKKKKEECINTFQGH